MIEPTRQTSKLTTELITFCMLKKGHFDRGINKDIWTFSHFGIYTFPSGKMGSDITILSPLEFQKQTNHCHKL